MLSKNKRAGDYFRAAIFALIAALGLNVDLSQITSLDDFRIEGYPISRYQEVTGHLSSAMEVMATFFAGFSGNSILWLCIFFMLWMLFYRAAAVKTFRIHRYALITAAFFSWLYIIGFSINKYASLIAVTGSRIALMKSIIAFTGIALVFYALLAIFFAKVIDYDFDDAKLGNISLLNSDRKAFIRRGAVIFMCWLPYLIVYLPGFLPRDTTGQLAQAMGDSPLSGQHPIFMTALIGIFIRIGMLLGSANLGMLLYSLFQMIVVAAAFSYILQSLAKQNIHIYVRIVTLLYFMLYPVHAFFSFTMWKDTLFSVAFMLVTLKIMQMISNPDEFFIQNKNGFVFGLLCGALYLMRNNGFYILLILFPVLLISLRRYWQKILASFGIFAAFFVAIQIINISLNVEKGPIGEALSLPLQQITYTAIKRGAELSDSDKALIAAILPFDQLPRLYNPMISDPIKGALDEAAFHSERGAYVSLWLRLFRKHPGAYFEAFLYHTHGYWYPDIDYWIVAREMWPNDYGIHDFRLAPKFVENVFSGVFVMRVFPAVSMLISIGFSVWVTIIMALVLLLKRKYKMILGFFPVFLLWLTCITSPVSGMFRYIYGLFLVLPLLFYIAFQND